MEALQHQEARPEHREISPSDAALKMNDPIIANDGAE